MKTGFKVFSILAIFVFVFGFVTTRDVGAATLCVNPGGTDGCYATIQGAINAASAGDTITIADGTYTYLTEGSPAPDGLIKVSKPVTIKAADDGNNIRPVIDSSGFNGVFKIYTTTFTNGTIVIEGLDVTGDPYTSVAITAPMYQVPGQENTIIIRDNLIHGMLGGIDFWGSGGPDVQNKVISHIEITNNEFYDLGYPGFRGVGIMLEDPANWAKAGDDYAAVITGNTFANIIDGSGEFEDWGVGIVIPRADASNGEAANVLIQNNTFFPTVSIDVGILNGDVSSTKIEYNNFGDASGYALIADSITNGPIDAAYNWWGADTGPAASTNPTGGGDGISDDVSYGPWCTDEECSAFYTPPVHNTTQNTYFTTIQAAVATAVDYDVIEVAAGTYIISESMTIDKDITLTGIGNPLIQVSGTGERIIMTTPGATLQGFWIEKTDKAGVQNIIYVGANNLTIQNNKIWGQYVYPEGDVSRAMVFTGGLSGLLIHNNEIFDLRQPAYISGVSTGTISNNFVYRTKGWVLEQGDMTFTGNTWGTGVDANIFDIAILAGVNPIYYTDVPALSAANNDAVIEDQRLTTPLLSVVYVDDSSTCASDCGGPARPYSTIPAGIARVMPGGTVIVADGTYTITGPLTLNKANITVESISGAASTIIDVQGTGLFNGVEVLANLGNVTFDGFTVQNFTQDGIKQSYTQKAGTAFHVLNNIVIPADDYLRNGIEVTGDGSTVIGNTIYGKLLTVDWASCGIQVDDASHVDVLNNTINGDTIVDYGICVAAWDYDIDDVLIQGNTISNANNAIGLMTGIYTSQVLSNISIIDNVLSNSTVGVSATSTEYGGSTLVLTLDDLIKIENNEFTGITGNDVLIGEDVAAGSSLVLDATPNWWGQNTGPTADDILSDSVAIPESSIGFIPWCTNTSCTTLGAPVTNTTRGTYFATIQSAINDTATVGGDVIAVASGIYNEDVTINKSITLKGAGAGSTTIRGPIGGAGSTITVGASNVVIDGFTITRAGNNLTDWNNVGLNTAGIAIQGQALTGTVIQNNTITGMRTGIDINNTNGHTIQNNNITDNRTGFIFRNQTDNMTVTGNDITNNWTVGVLFLDASLGANVPVQTALNSHFNDNNISGNWYGQVVDRQSGGSLPLPGTTNLKNFVENWWGTTTPVVSTANSAEPGYGDLIPVAYGGDDVAPAGQPDILGTASANIVYWPLCSDATCATFIYPPVHNTTKNTYYFTIQAAIDAAATGNTIEVAPGTYVESLDIIGKDIILRAPSGATIESPVDIATDFTTSAANSAVVYLNNTTSTIDGFTIDGASHGNANYRFYGVAFYNAGGAIQNTTVKNIQDTPFSGAQHGNAIYAYNTDGIARTIDVSGNTVYDFQKNGITMNGVLLTANVDDNVVTCKGTTSVTAQNGIQFGWGSTGTIANNTVTGCSYNKDSDLTYNWSATGILLYGTGAVTVTGNTISGNSQNLYISEPTAAVTVGANTFGAVTGPVGSSYQVINYSDFDIDLTLSTFEGLLLSGATPEQLLPFAALIYDGIDDPDVSGVAMLKDGYEFVDAEGSIQAAIDAATPGDIIMVAAGTYEENVIVNKTVEIFGAGQGSTIVIPAISGANPAGCGSLCPLASSVFLVQANGVKIHDLTVEGNNPDLTGVIAGGVDVDARNGIITNHSAGVFNNLEVYNTTVQNIFLRGIYPSSGGSFNIHHNTVTNVLGNTSSIAIFGWGGPGTFANNTVSYANDGISANHSKGIQFLNNTISFSGSGIHTDNSGDGGGVSDVITGNTVSNCTTSGYGIWTFVNYLPITVSNNSVTGCEIAYSVWGGRFGTPTQLVQFNNNTATAPVPNTNSVGIYITTDTIGWGYTDVLASFTGNTITGFENGVYMTVDQQSWNPGTYELKTITSTFLHNQITGSTTMLADLGTTPIVVDMEANWWGSAVKADFQAKINGSIDFSPWCGDAACTTLVYEVTPGYSIQAAIDAAAPGDTVFVGPGTYSEAITVNKPLTLTGAGDDVTIIDGTGLTSATLFKVTGPTSGVLNISGFTFKDDPVSDAAMTYLVSFSGCTDPASINFTDNTIIGSGDTDYDWGLLAQNTTCPIVINNNTFDNIGGNSIMLERATGPVEIGNNIFSAPDDGGPVIWSMSYGTLADPGTVTGLQWYHDNQISAKNSSIWSGIVVAPAWGSGWDVRQYGSYTNVLIEDNVIEDFKSVGVQIEVDGTNSTFNGEIRNNTLTAYPLVTTSKGIRLLGPITNTSLTGNIITQAYRGIYLSGTWGQPIYPSGITVEMNRLAGNVFGYEEVDTTLDQDISPNWWGSKTGPAAGYVVNNTGSAQWCGEITCTRLYPILMGSPVSTLTSWDKTFNWEAVPGALYYILNVSKDDGTWVAQNYWISAENANCSSDSTCSYNFPGMNFSNVPYRWQVLDYGAYGYGIWTANQSFVLNIAPTNTIISPVDTLTTWDKTFRWTGVPGATYYVLNVAKADGTFLAQNYWITSTAAHCSTGTNCYYTFPNLNMPNGPYKWQVLDYGAFGYGKWTPYSNFTFALTPMVSTPTAPVGTVSGWDKVFRWTGNEGATYYILNVQKADNTYLARSYWISASAANCSTGTSCSYTFPGMNFALGSYKWQILNYGSYGYGSWSTIQEFTLE